jgi:hypothetical protein
MSLPESVTDLNLVESEIPPAVIELPQSEEAPEAKELFVSFARYNDGECELDGMDNKLARKAFQALRDVGVNIRTHDDFPLRLPKLEVKPVHPSGQYKKIYRSISDLPDTQISEIKFDKDKGRLFFFMVSQVFYLVAVRQSHYE